MPPKLFMSVSTRFVLLFLLILLGAGAVFYSHILVVAQNAPSWPHFTSKEKTDRGILFVGDIMLARNVEKLSIANGYEYPFTEVTALHEKYDSVVGNFEATVPSIHVPTPSFQFAFSVPEKALSALRDAHITHVSLANNHGADFGEEGFRNAKKVLGNLGIVSFGDPRNPNGDRTVITQNGVRIGIIGINATWRIPTQDELVPAFAALREDTDIQIVFVHWGEEYKTSHRTIEEDLAKAFIGLGADAIIGHHPHVTQDIGMISGVPVFYSLGNYIFDQYWNSEVQTGYTVALTVDKKGSVSYKLIPVKSTQSVPRVMTEEEETAFLLEMSKKSSPELEQEIRQGVITDTY